MTPIFFYGGSLTTQNSTVTAEKSFAKNDNRIIVSSASAWEIATKYRIGKLPEAKQLVEEYSQILYQAKFIELAITTAHAKRAGSLPIAHRDPFDRMIMAQALT